MIEHGALRRTCFRLSIEMFRDVTVRRQIVLLSNRVAALVRRQGHKDRRFQEGVGIVRVAQFLLCVRRISIVLLRHLSGVD